MPDYISAVDAAAKWGITPRRVAILCTQERIPGARKIGKTWLIPDDAEKPPDARIKSGKYINRKSSSRSFMIHTKNLETNGSEGEQQHEKN